MVDITTLAVEDMDVFSMEELERYINAAGVELITVEEKLHQLRTLESVVRLEGASYASMEALVEIYPEALSELSPLGSFTQEPSATNMEYATEGLMQSIINGFVALVKKAVELIMAVVNFVIKVFNRIFQTAESDSGNEAKVEKAKKELKESMQTLTTEIKQAYVTVPSKADLGVAENAPTLLQQLSARFNRKVDTMLATGESGYTTNNAIEALNAYVEILKTVVGLGDDYMTAIDKLWEEAKPTGNSIPKILKELEEIYTHVIFQIPVSPVDLSILLQGPITGGELIGCQLVVDYGKGHDKVVQIYEDDFWNVKYVYEKSQKKEADPIKEINLFYRQDWLTTLGGNPADGNFITPLTIKDAVNERAVLRKSLEDISKETKTLSKQTDRLKGDFDKQIKGLSKQASSRTKRWAATKYEPHGVIWPENYKGIMAGSNMAPPRAGVDKNYYRADQFPTELMGGSKNVVSRISRVAIFVSKLVKDGEFPLKRRLDFIKDSIAYQMAVYEDEKRYHNALKKWKTQKKAEKK